MNLENFEVVPRYNDNIDNSMIHVIAFIWAAWPWHAFSIWPSPFTWNQVHPMIHQIAVHRNL